MSQRGGSGVMIGKISESRGKKNSLFCRGLLLNLIRVAEGVLGPGLPGPGCAEATRFDAA